ncbi:MAG: DNA-binding MarR family transcriptional regulator [Granulosicoccus sp.]|jgi:DNA-binding MarR family transcriptional regulator
MHKNELVGTIAEFKNAWTQERPDLDPTAVATDLRMQLVARHFANSSNSALSDFDLEWWEYDVLSALRRIGKPYVCAANSINDILPLTSGALTHRLNRLVDRKLVTRRGDDHDRRRVLVKLTSKGLSLVNSAAKARFQAAENTVQALSNTDRANLDRILDKLLPAAL